LTHPHMVCQCQWFVNDLWISADILSYQNVPECIRICFNTSECSKILAQCVICEKPCETCLAREKKPLDSKPISRKIPLSPELPCFHSLDEIAPWQQRPRHFTATPEFPKNQQDDLHQGNNKCENRNHHLITVPLCWAVQSQLST
jgi:hypothetical protein